MKERGAKGRNRTADTSIFSAVLYRLSYLGMPAGGLTERSVAFRPLPCQASIGARAARLGASTRRFDASPGMFYTPS